MTSFWVVIVNGVLLGIALAMDAFSVSLSNGLQYPKAGKKTSFAIASVFAFFQTAMPLIGWFCVKSVADAFEKFQIFIPWIALILLAFLGIKMIIEGAKGGEEIKTVSLSFSTLAVQGVATSIDALSVGFTISNLPVVLAVLESVIIGIVTFIICVCGVEIGKKFGTKLSGKATILGGIILLIIGIEIFVKGIFF
ncbi:MAG: manganese efflux pump [Firmicutes bacterium]|nr:manganese efflux pump [Candidatus Colimorpha enterica]